ncbi:integrase family protein [Chromobacterium vaccinii]|nr:integrase family protein [Chromobacterium vaccinii]
MRELRGMLAEGRNFRDWKWAQQAMEAGRSGGDWFVVDPLVIDSKEPDCVARQRAASKYEIENKGYPAEVWELWSPVRAVALYLKLELPLRTFQVRMLDSGEADSWRYVHAPGGGGFVLNHGALATGSAKRPYQRGVFHRSANEKEAGFYINTNKTADINKAENEKGYVIPWANDEVLY